MAWQRGQPITPAECERIATLLHNRSISREVDYAGDALRQAGRQLRGVRRGVPDRSPAQEPPGPEPPDIGSDVPGGGAS